ncbi:MAG: ATP-binding protein [Candidatus Margulisiibacteriota bacterium]|jgi:two-component system sensor histidine kinase KdpD
MIFSPWRLPLSDLIKTVVIVIGIAMANHLLLPFIGYQSTGLIFLLSVLFLGLFVSFPVLILYAGLSALTWNFFFIPPHGTFAIAKTEDLMMNIVYFIAAIITGYLTDKIKGHQRQLALKEAREGLYLTIFDSLSHELRTPITSIIGIVSTLKTAEENKELTAELAESAERLDRIVTNLLDMSRLSSGSIALKKEWQESSEMVQVCLRHLEPKLADHQLEVETEENLPLVQADFVLFEQALSNVLLNAANYSPAGSLILVKTTRQNNWLLVTVTDNGPGIAAKELPFVFDKFYRAADSLPGGTGLGLAIAKSALEVSGGKIKARNRQEGGLEVELFWPIDKQPEIKGLTL